MRKPADLKWKLLHYNDPTISLIPSDYEIMKQNFEEPPVIEGNYASSPPSILLIKTVEK